MIADAAEQWEREGWVVVRGLLPEADVAAALAEIPPRDEIPAVDSGPLRRADQLGEPRFRNKQFDGTTLFPFPNAPQLNRLFVHPALIALAEAMLGTDDIRMYQARVWSKYGDHTNYEQPHHIDGNHALVPIRQGAPWGHVEFFVYLHDLDDSNGAPRAVPASAAGRNGLGIGEGLGGAGTAVRNASSDETAHLYQHEVSAAGGAGSVFAYRSDVWHRGIDIPAGAERHLLPVAFRTAVAEWIGFDEFAPMVNRPDFVEFAESCTPEQLSLFGVPRPGHDYWTSEVLDAMARIYPKLNLTPWRDALESA